MARKDNKGFTLLELLVAVVILAVIIVPMLRSFVSSYRVNARSRENMRATTLAQNEMEIFEKEKIEDLLDTTKFGYTVTKKPDETNVNDPGLYEFTKLGIINDESGKDWYDVVVKLNPERVTASDLYYAQNTQDILFMNTISGIDSGSYIQRVRNDVNENGEDEEVYKLYMTRQHPEGVTGNKWDTQRFAEELTRKITVKIEQEDQGGYKTTVAKVRYDYMIDHIWGIVPDEYEKYTTKDRVFFNNSQTLDEDGKPVELKSLYLFYAPRYDTTNVDEIVIENENKLPVNIYIIRQNILDPSSPATGVELDGEIVQNARQVPVGYHASIEIKEGFDADGKTFGKYFTNLNLMDSSSLTNPGTTTLKLYDYDNPGRVFTKNEIIEYTSLKSLETTEAKDRIYTMEALVYTHGADRDTEEPLVRLTGTKIE